MNQTVADQLAEILRADHQGLRSRQQELLERLRQQKASLETRVRTLQDTRREELDLRLAEVTRLVTTAEQRLREVSQEEVQRRRQRLTSASEVLARQEAAMQEQLLDKARRFLMGTFHRETGWEPAAAAPVAPPEATPAVLEKLETNPQVQMLRTWMAGQLKRAHQTMGDYSGEIMANESQRRELEELRQREVEMLRGLDIRHQVSPQVIASYQALGAEEARHFATKLRIKLQDAELEIQWRTYARPELDRLQQQSKIDP